MSCPDLRSYLNDLTQRGVLRRHRQAVDADEALARRIFEADGTPLLFDQVKGHAPRIVANVVATRELLAQALGVEHADLLAHVAKAMGAPGQLRRIDDAPFLRTHFDGEQLLQRVPLMRFYPRGDRRYASSCVICARHPSFGINLSYHRMMYLGGKRLAVRVVPRHLHQILEQGGGQAEVAVAVGLHPAIALAAAISYGPDFDELACAASLLGQTLDYVELDGLHVPAGAEMVWRGRFTGELAEEGPFVDLTGTYDGLRQQPVLEIERIYQRDDVIFPLILPGGMEHKVLMGVPQEPRIFRVVRNTVPGLRDLVLTPGGVGWLHAVLSIDARSAGQGKNAGLAALAAHPSLKRAVVVDSDIDIHDPHAVEWAMATRMQPDRDLMIVSGAQGSSLDPSRDAATETTSKWVIDATRPAGVDPAPFMRVEPPPLAE